MNDTVSLGMVEPANSEHELEQVKECNDNPKYVGDNHMLPCDELALSCTHPPNVDHGVVCASLVLQIV